MSLGGKKKTTTNSTSSDSYTKNPLVPDWVSSIDKDLAGRISGLADLDPASLVAGANPLQTQAAAGAANLGGLSGNYADATAITKGIADAKAPSLLDNLSAYINPYQQQVIDTTLSDFDANAAATRAQQTLDEANSSAFGDSGAALARSLTAGESQRARATADAALRAQGFNTAAGLAGSDADRILTSNGQKLGAAGQLADLASASDANSRANISSQSDLGELLRSIQNQQGQAGITQLASIVELLNGLGLNKYIGQEGTGNSTSNSTTVEKSTPGLTDLVGAAGSLAMGLGTGGLGLSFGSLLKPKAA